MGGGIFTDAEYEKAQAKIDREANRVAALECATRILPGEVPIDQVLNTAEKFYKWIVFQPEE